ncbi:Putative nickel-responsive regulator [uncultured archaeon]|nr:Putative nickel-responsive regulator [uncultured archaeon]
MSVERIAVSLEPELLKKLQASMGRRVYWNRSKAISDILRDWFSNEEWAGGKGVKVGAISLVYNHHTRGVLDRITGIQHDSGATIISTMHVHLSHDECLEMIAVKGGAKQIQKIADSLASVRGVKSCKLSVVK